MDVLSIIGLVTCVWLLFGALAMILAIIHDGGLSGEPVYWIPVGICLGMMSMALIVYCMYDDRRKGKA